MSNLTQHLSLFPTEMTSHCSQQNERYHWEEYKRKG